jgi:hypothetical protein
MNARSRTPFRSNVLVLLLAMAATPFPWLPNAAAAAAPPVLTTKGFVTAKSDTTLIVREGSKRLVVAVSANTTVVGKRDSFDAIAPNDLIRAEGRMAGNRLAATRVEVLLTAEGLRDRPQPKELEIDLLTIEISP